MACSLRSEPTTTDSSPPSSRQPNYQIFRIESPANHHKLFVQAEASHPHSSFFAHVIHPADPSRTTMIFVEDTADKSDPLAGALTTKHLGSVAPGSFDGFRAVCRENPPPETPGAGDSSRDDERLRRGRVWAQQTVDLLLEANILQPPALAAGPAHQLPRHHHTRHCVHQKLHCHHPYRRQSRDQPDSPLAAAAATIRER